MTQRGLRWLGVLAILASVVIAAACGGSSSAGSNEADAGTEAGAPAFTSCRAAPPAGFTPPKLPTYSGTCPTLSLTPSDAGAGSVPPENDIVSSGAMRQFKLVTPSDLKPDEKVPVVFLWFWLGANAQDFIDKADIINAAQQQRFIAVVPEAKMNGTSTAYPFKWPFDVTSASHLPEEFTFFDDMLACVAQQFPNNANPSCISSAGVSAGALFTDQLAPARSNVIASFLSLSGGVAGSAPSCSVGLPCLQPWTSPKQRDMPALVLWGGPMNTCVVIDFQPASQNLEVALTAEGSFFIECEHNCEHNVPPFVAPAGMTQFAAFWDFVYDHPYWLPKGESPYKTRGLPSSFPSWCSAKGKGTAVERTGVCGPSACSVATTGDAGAD